ncbi:MAG: T9SS type A sorting domain-containing protein [Chitinispirillaceae bacterium]|nr:T9SS type A sorting domain-containing protein [Chitinispirillaceae bacterium]
MNRITMLVVALMMGTTLSEARERPDVVAGNLRQFNDNGAWNRSQGEPVVIDVGKNRLLAGSVACSLGAAGEERAGNVEAIVSDLATGAVEWFILRAGDADTFRGDERHAPAFVIRPDGRYLAMYAPYFRDTSSCYRIVNDGFWVEWGDEMRFNWSVARSGGPDFSIAYSNPVYLSSERMMYNFVGGNNGSSHLMVSRDSGGTWTYCGQLLKASANVAPENSFCNYCGNSIDRIDIVVTEDHGNDTPAGIYHGYIRSGALYNSLGSVVDASIFDTLAVPRADQLTTIFTDNTALNDSTIRPGANIDVQYYGGDTVAAVVRARTGGNQGGNGSAADATYCLVYCRFDGKAWKQTMLGKAGLKPAAQEQETAGSAALDSHDKNIVYISSIRDPRNDSSFGVYELFMGVTPDRGGTWEWVPITWNSDRDNLRPVVPTWDGNNTALLWLRGRRLSTQQYDAAIVGIIDHRGETAGKKRYVDAGKHNCLIGCGVDSLDLSPGDTTGGPDYRWHERTGCGNNGTVIVSAEEPEGEDAPLIKEGVDITEAGIYDFWANFWGKPDTRSDWQIAAGLSAISLQIYRQMACRTVDASEYDVPPLVTIGDTLFLYQAYAGRDTIESAEHVYVYIDDHLIVNGVSFKQEGDGKRSWFDGISYAPIVPAGRIAGKRTVTVFSPLLKLHPVPSRSLLNVTYSIDRKGIAELALFDMRGRLIRSHGSSVRQPGTYTATFSTDRLAAGVYFCRLTAEKSVATAAVKIVR